MTRLTIPSAMRADRAEVLSDNEDPLSPEEEAFIVNRADLLLANRLNDRALFHDLLSGIDATEIEPHLHRALMNLDRAIKGEMVGRDAVFTALSIIQSRVRQEAQIVWADECRAEAEQQLNAETQA